MFSDLDIISFLIFAKIVMLILENYNIITLYYLKLYNLSLL